MKGFQAIIFDLDGTLYDSMQFIEGAARDVAEAAAERTGADAGEFFEKLLASYAEKTSYYSKHIDDVLEAMSLDASVKKDLVKVFNRHEPTLTLYPGAADLLKLLRREYRLGLVTDGEPKKQRRKVEMLGLKDAFDAIIYNGDLGAQFYKPHIRGFEEVKRRLKLRRKQRVMCVGDNPFTDFEPAQALGIVSVRVRAGEFADVDVEGMPEPDYEIDDIIQLPMILAEEDE